MSVSVVIGLATAAAGCLPGAKNVLGETEAGTGDTAGDDATEAGPNEPDGTGMFDGTGDGGDMTDDGDEAGSTGEVDPNQGVEDGVADCSAIAPGGPTVAGGEITATGFPEFRCDPAANDPVGSNEYSCCSVDPAAEGGQLPAYVRKGIDGGLPYFAEGNNGLSRWGMCIRTDDIPAGSGLTSPAAPNCPIPCNPTWDAADIGTVCGPSRVCCQTHELQESDCIQDADTGEWRAVTGADIGTSTDWASDAHATHQDPAGIACDMLSGGLQTEEFLDCIGQLSVANQRGVCLALGPGQVCATDEPDYVDACEALNMR